MFYGLESFRRTNGYETRAINEVNQFVSNVVGCNKYFPVRDGLTFAEKFHKKRSALTLSNAVYTFAN